MCKVWLYFENNSSRAVAIILNIGINICIMLIKTYINKKNRKNIRKKLKVFVTSIVTFYE